MTATYRLQLHDGFTFADAARIVPYLADLGITHLYLSPVLAAVPGSAHGYDVVDHTRVSETLGGEPGLVALAGTAREHGLGIVVDVVPNHMALVAPEDANAPLWQALAGGPQAATAHWFDVDWKVLDGRFGLPLLGDTLEATLAAGELVLEERETGRVVRYHDHVFPVAEGTWAPGDEVATVLSRQHYQLASWRQKDEVLNYRRFFDVDSLVAVRVEEPDVFEATHRVLLDLNHAGIVDGFRIDHPDGLADPEGYLRMLDAATRPGTAIWVEKILEGEEALPTSWPCAGTTGYDALKAVTAALVDTSAAVALDEAWRAAGGDPDGRGAEAVVAGAKHEVVDRLLGPERARLTRRAAEALPGLEPARLAEAVGALLVACHVYRAYARPGAPADEQARAVLQGARGRAVDERPDLAEELTALVEVASDPTAPDVADPDAATDLAIRLQQTWGPVMAKAIEDTTYYRWHRLVALNEVGGDPGLLDAATPQLLHGWADRQQRDWPLGMTTLSTHDTKRSEDVRARVLALAGDAETWREVSEAFTAAAAEHDVDAPTAHLLWQTLAGAGDIGEERLGGYLTKAVREAKQHTAWVDGDESYEKRVLALASAATAAGPLRALVDAALDRNQQAVRALTLGQKLLQLTVPGVPDTYQGCELVDLSLVDPDNRRPVDYADRRDRLARLGSEAPAVAGDLSDEKLLVTSRALRLRRRRPHDFDEHGAHVPLPTSSRHALAYRRGDGVAVVVTRAPQRLEAAGGWGDHTVTLPEGRWREELTGALHDGGRQPCATVLATLPVALLARA